MHHLLPSLRWGIVSALLVLSSASARVLSRQQTDGSGPVTVGATSTYAVSVESTYANNNAPTATFSANVTTTAAPSEATSSLDKLPTKFYKLEFTRGWVDTNGNPRQAILINGQTPGPLIEAEEGQELTVSRLGDNQQGEPCVDIVTYRLKSSITSIRPALSTPTASSSPFTPGPMEFQASRRRASPYFKSVIADLLLAQTIPYRSRSDVQLHLYATPARPILVCHSLLDE